MASVSDIQDVRLNTGEETNVAPFTDGYISSLVDSLGVTGAVVSIWRQKAASVVGLVNVSEAGASHSASDLFKHANEMLEHWTTVLQAEVSPPALGPRIKKIVRS
jgi:hypothetical protein